MEKKIKILHVCTIIAIIIFCITQCWWLYTRYDYIWQNYNEELYRHSCKYPWLIFVV